MSLPQSFNFTCPRELLFDDTGRLLVYRADRNANGSYTVRIPGNKERPGGATVAYAGVTVERFVREGGWLIENRPAPIDLKALIGVCVIMGAYVGFLVWVMLP